MDLVRTASVLAIMLVMSGCIGGEDTSTAGTQKIVEKPQATAPAEKTETTLAAKPTTTQAAEVTTTQAAGGGILTDLAAALSSNIAYRCTYKYNGVTAESWVKGQKFYMESATGGGTAYALSDGTWMYSWMGAQKEGTKFNIEDMKKLGSGGGQKQSDMTEVSRTAVDVECSPDVAAESKFIPPADVSFTDMGEVLKQMSAGGIPNMPQP